MCVAVTFIYAFVEISEIQVKRGHAIEIFLLSLSIIKTKEKAQKKLAEKAREKEDDNKETSSDEEDSLVVIHDEDDDEDDDELVKGSLMHVEVKVVEAYDLPPALCNYVFCQYKFDDNTIVVPPINASISNPGPKTNTMIFEHKQVRIITACLQCTFFLRYCLPPVHILPPPHPTGVVGDGE